MLHPPEPEEPRDGQWLLVEPVYEDGNEPWVVPTPSREEGAEHAVEVLRTVGGDHRHGDGGDLLLRIIKFRINSIRVGECSFG